MKKIKITKEQYNRITSLLKEGFPVLKKNLVDKTFQKEFANKNIKNLGETESDFNIKKDVPSKGVSRAGMGKFMKESIGDLKHETLELIKYLYRKTEEFSPFWAEHDLTYDDICDALESKGIIIKKDGKFELSKSLGSAEDAKQAVESELSQMIGGEKEEIEEGDWFDSHPDHPANQPDPSYSKASIQPNQLSFEGLYSNREIAILKDKSGQLYSLYYDNVSEEDLNSIAYDLGFAEEEYVGKDEDGMPEFDYYYDWRGNQDQEPLVLAAYADELANEAGEGLEDWENGVELVKIDDALKNELLSVYDKDTKLTSILSGVNEMDMGDIKSRLAEPFRQQPSGYEEKSPEEKERIRQSLAAIRAKSAAQDIERFKQRDAQNAMHSARAEKDITTKTLPIEPKKPIGQYNMFGGIDEMNAGDAGPFTPALGAQTIQKRMPIVTNVPVVREGMTATPNTTGEYTKPAFEMKKNHTDFAETKPKAFKKTQWAGGGFVEFNDCTKLNNKPAGSGCSAGAVDKVVTIKKTKGNVNAPSLSESKIYEAIAKKTGKTIDEVKRIIQSKNNKS